MLFFCIKSDTIEKYDFPVVTVYNNFGKDYSILIIKNKLIQVLTIRQIRQIA